MSDYWPYVVAIFAVLAIGWRLLVGQRPVRLILRDLDLDTSAESELRGTVGKWKGRDVALSIVDDDDYLPRRAVVCIAATPPSRLRVRELSVENLYITGPRRVECPLAPANAAVWADDPAFPQQLFSSPEMRERVAITISRRGDSIELNAGVVRVEVATERFDSEYSALWSAWRAATELIERMNFGLPPDGNIPFLEVRDGVATAGF